MAVLFDFSKLRGRIIEYYGSFAAFAEVVGLSRPQLSGRLHNKIPFKPEEVCLICSAEVLNIPGEEIHLYFFTPKV